MNAWEALGREFDVAIERFNSGPAIGMLKAGRMTVAHYKSILRQIYHYSKEDPQLQALAAVYFRGEDRATIKMFFKHATSEIGHDLMALNDLRTLGEDTSTIPYSNPLPTTIALTAYPFYQVTYLNPIGYLGYLYFLEFMPTRGGSGYVAALRHAGVPDEAMTFLHEHMTVDLAHNKLMEEYVRRLVRGESDLRSVVYAMHVTAQLYGSMLHGAMQAAELPFDYGSSAEELARMAA